jgi:hypothetical protein
MGNQKSKPTGTIHIRTIPASNKATIAINATDSAVPALEANSSAPDQDALAMATEASAITSDNAPGTAPVEDRESGSVDAVPASSPAEAAPDPSTSDANVSPALATMPQEPAPATAPLTPASEVAGAKTKMEIATEIFKRMKKGNGATRKEIIDQFVVEATLSKAGASTYYQLVKSKYEKK